MEGKKPFFASLPGVITGVATIATALAALIPLFVSADNRREERERREAAQQAAATSTPLPTAAPSGTAGTPSGVAPTPTSAMPETPAPTAAGAGPRVLVVPKTIDFGRTQAGSAGTTATVTISNIGTGNLDIRRAAMTGPNADAFTIVANTCTEGRTIPANAECEATIRYTPKVVGPSSAALVVEHSASGVPATVAMTGNATLL